MWARRQKAPKQKANYKMHYKFKDNQRKATAKSLSAQTVLNSVEWCVIKTVNIYLTLTKCNSQFYFFGWKCIYCCVRVWGSSVRSCFLTLCYRIVLSRSLNSRVCASLLMCECMCVGVFNAASNKPTKTVVAVAAAAGKANTKLVSLAAVSVGLVAECYGIAPCSPLPRAVAPFCEWNCCVCVCDDALTPAHVPTHRLKQAYIRIHMHIYSNVWVFSWMEFEFDVLFSCLALPPTKHIHTHTHTDRHPSY